MTVWAVDNETAQVAVTTYDRQIFFGPNLVPSITWGFFLGGKLKILKNFRIFFRFSTDEITLPTFRVPFEPSSPITDLQRRVFLCARVTEYYQLQAGLSRLHPY